MATDDCSPEGEGPCPCGKGVISVERCTPDHPWARESQTTYPASMKCTECEKTFVLAPSDHAVEKRSRLVVRADYEKQKVLETMAFEAMRTADKLPAAENVRAAAAALLDAEPSMAARHRLLSSNRIHVPAIASFRRSYRNGADWMAQPMGYAMDRLMKMTGVHDDEIAALYEEAHKLHEQSKTPVPTIKTGIKGLQE